VNETKVSIIVPVYNAEKYLDRCLNSLINQTLKDIEIILVDDSSPDSSPEICDKAKKKDSRIKVIHKKNEGAGIARNEGLKIATGKYIGFIDSDDYIDFKMFENLYNVAEKYHSDLVMSGVLFVDGNMFSKEGECVRKSYFGADTHFETEEDLKKLRLGIVGAPPGEYDDSKYGMSVWKNLFRLDIIQKNNLLFESEREMLSEDALFMIDYISCIKKATGINDSFYYYCRNEESISKSYMKERLEKGLVFIKEAEKRFRKDISYEEYSVYIDRFWQAFCRVLCSQEIMYAAENDVSYTDLKKRLKLICKHSKTCSVLKKYPISKLPLKQAVFAFAMKYKMYFLLKRLVTLRSR